MRYFITCDDGKRRAVIQEVESVEQGKALIPLWQTRIHELMAEEKLKYECIHWATWKVVGCENAILAGLRQTTLADCFGAMELEGGR